MSVAREMEVGRAAVKAAVGVALAAGNDFEQVEMAVREKCAGWGQNQRPATHRQPHRDEMVSAGADVLEPDAYLGTENSRRGWAESVLDAALASVPMCSHGRVFVVDGDDGYRYHLDADGTYGERCE